LKRISLLAILLLSLCQSPNRDNKLDPKSSYYTSPKYNLTINTSEAFIDLADQRDVYLSAIFKKNNKDITGSLDITADLSYTFINANDDIGNSIISIDQGGFIYPLNEGKVEIIASFEYNDEAVVSEPYPFEIVNNPPELVLTITNSAALINVDNPIQVSVSASLTEDGIDISDNLIVDEIDYIFKDKNGDIDNSIISINANGTVVPISEGSINITAKFIYNDKEVESNSIPFEITSDAADITPPAIISPTNEEKITLLQTTLIWSAKAKAENYLVEVVMDDETGDPFLDSLNNIAGSPFTTNAPENTLDIVLPDDGTYFWRVRANTTDVGKYSELEGGGYPRFYAFNDAIYVYCAEATTCDDTDKIGYKTSPFQNVPAAINLYAELGLIVKIAARGGSARYNGTVSMINGLQLYGGFDSITWSRDLVNSETFLQSPNCFTVGFLSISGPKETILDGFNIKNVDYFQCRAIYVAETTTNAIIRNNTIIGTGGTSAGGIGEGIFLTNSSPQIYNNVITVEAGEKKRGVRAVLGSTPIIRNNTIFFPAWDSLNYGIIIGANAAGIIIENNIIFNCGRTISEGTGGTPLSVKNNFFFSYTMDDFYHQGSVPLTEIQLNTLSFASGNADGVFNTSPSTIFVNESSDWRLKSAASCNVLFGGLDLSSYFLNDKDLVSRTAVLPGGSPCTTTNNGAAGWSVGAYEYVP